MHDGYLYHITLMLMESLLMFHHLDKHINENASGQVLLLEQALALVRSSKQSEQAVDRIQKMRMVCLILEAGRQTHEGIYM